MALQGRFIRFCSILGNYNKNLVGNVYWNNFPSIQQVAGLRKSVEESLHLPPKPKRPLTPFFKFMAQIRSDIRQANPNAKVTDLVKETALKWDKVDPQYKAELDAEYKKEHQIYTKQKSEYERNLTDEQKNFIKLAKLDRIEEREKAKLKKKCKENNRPKKPSSAFVLYMKTRIQSRGNTKLKDFVKQVAAEWQKLPDSQKKPFIEDVNNQLKEYQKLMVEWERKMIKMGNVDIVRKDALIDPKTKHRTKKSE